MMGESRGDIWVDDGINLWEKYGKIIWEKYTRYDKYMGKMMKRIHMLT